MKYILWSLFLLLIIILLMILLGCGGGARMNIIALKSDNRVSIDCINYSSPDFNVAGSELYNKEVVEKYGWQYDAIYIDPANSKVIGVKVTLTSQERGDWYREKNSNGHPKY